MDREDQQADGDLAAVRNAHRQRVRNKTVAGAPREGLELVGGGLEYGDPRTELIVNASEPNSFLLFVGTVGGPPGAYACHSFPVGTSLERQSEIAHGRGWSWGCRAAVHHVSIDLGQVHRPVRC